VSSCVLKCQQLEKSNMFPVMLALALIFFYLYANIFILFGCLNTALVNRLVLTYSVQFASSVLQRY